MKRYVKNKYFIPTSFVELLENNYTQKNNKLILLLLMINILISPNSISKIFTNLEDESSVPVTNFNNIKEENKKEKLVFLLNSIDNNIKSMKIENNKGSIKIDSIEKIYFIEEENKYKINSVVKEDTDIIIEVEL